MVKKLKKKEIRYDAKLMSQFEASLPNELDLEQCKALMYDFSSTSLVKRGMISDWSIHWVLHNKHVHANTTTVEITGEGFGKKVREWEEKKTLYALGKEWAECVNKHLAMAGFDARIDHRSFKDQGIDHEPTETTLAQLVQTILKWLLNVRQEIAALVAETELLMPPKSRC